MLAVLGAGLKMLFKLQKQRSFIAPPADFVQHKRIQENFVLHLHKWNVIVWYNSYGGEALHCKT
jgi:hypothetical protein